jgi:hypothetical protein
MEGAMFDWLKSLQWDRSEIEAEVRALSDEDLETYLAWADHSLRFELARIGEAAEERKRRRGRPWTLPSEVTEELLYHADFMARVAA